MITGPRTGTVYSQIEGVVAWSSGSTVLRKGQAMQAGSLIVRELPHMFAEAPPIEQFGATVALPTCWYWNCKAEFTPGGNPGAVQRYCSPKCRKNRETELRKAVRIVTKRRFPELPRTSGRGAKQAAYERLLEFEGTIALVRSLIEHLGGQIEVGSPPEVDEPLLAKLSNRGDLLWYAKRAYSNPDGVPGLGLMELRNKCATAVQEASRNEELQNQADAGAISWQRGNQRGLAVKAQWDDALGPDPDETELRALQGIR